MYLLAATTLALASATPAHGVRPDHAVEYEYLYDLASFDGEVEAPFARLTFDASANEVYVLRDGVRIFNDHGMELFAFGSDEQLGHLRDLAILPDGRIYALTLLRGQAAVVECNFRGTPRGRVELRGLPEAEAAEFSPAGIHVRGERIYLTDTQRNQVVITDLDGVYERTVHLFEQLELDGDSVDDHHISGISIGPDGSVLFTVPTLFAAFVLAPSGELRRFGGKGSKPGQFNVAGAIAADDAGAIYVTDVLRAVVMVFDRELRFRGEFGYRGEWPGRLVTPRGIAAGKGVVYVSQGAHRGVSVFRVSSPSPISETGAVPAPRTSPIHASDSPAVPLVSQNKEIAR